MNIAAIDKEIEKFSALESELTSVSTTEVAKGQIRMVGTKKGLQLSTFMFQEGDVVVDESCYFSAGRLILFTSTQSYDVDEPEEGLPSSSQRLYVKDGKIISPDAKIDASSLIRHCKTMLNLSQSKNSGKTEFEPFR